MQIRCLWVRSIPMSLLYREASHIHLLSQCSLSSSTSYCVSPKLRACRSSQVSRYASMTVSHRVDCKVLTMRVRYLAHAEVDDPFCDYMQTETPAASLAVKSLKIRRCTIAQFKAASSAGSTPPDALSTP